MRHYFVNKGPSSQGYGFFSGYVWLWGLDYIKKAEYWGIDAFELWLLEKTLESPLDCKEIQPVHPKGDQSEVFIGRTDVEAESPILWPPDANSWLIWKDPDAGKDWGQEENWTTEDEMVGWHHQLDGHEFEQASGVVMDRDAYCATVHGVAKSWTRLSDWVELRAWSSPECSGEPKECLGLRSNRSSLCFRKITLGWGWRYTGLETRRFI